MLTAVFAPLLAPYSPTEVHFDAPFQRPFTVGYPLGTDDLGRDVLSRIVYGTRASLLVGLMSVLLAVSSVRRSVWSPATGGGLDAARVAADRPDAGVPVPDHRGGPRGHQRSEPDQRRDRARHRPDPDHGAGGPRRDAAAQGAGFVLAARTLDASGGRIMSQHILPNAPRR